MPHLSTFWIALIATAGLSLAGLVYLLIGWLRKRSGRVLVRGAGFVLVPIGLMVMGWMELGVQGVQSLIDWSNAHTMSVRIQIGLIVAAVGVVLYVIGSLMAPIVGEAAKQRRAELAAKRAALNGPPPAKAAPAKPAVQPAKAPAPAARPAPAPATAPGAALDPATDDEIDEILRRHGIS